jgi:hypothetical protein
MSVDRYEQGQAAGPWCLACGFQHGPEKHCEGCNGDHSAGYCMTNELVAELAGIGDLRERVAAEADRLFSQALRIVRQEGGE